jgi:hypothetical protein
LSISEALFWLKAVYPADERAKFPRGALAQLLGWRRFLASSDEFDLDLSQAEDLRSVKPRAPPEIPLG